MAGVPCSTTGGGSLVGSWEHGGPWLGIPPESRIRHGVPGCSYLTTPNNDILRRMSVIAELRIHPDDFELGQILDLDGSSAIGLETLVPSGDVAVPLFWAYEPIRASFTDSVERYPTVNKIIEVDAYEDRTLFKLDWDATQDHLFSCIMANDGQIISATGTATSWDFEIRFPDRAAMRDYQTCCEDAHISVDFIRIYNPTSPEGSPWYGLSDPQYDALTLAVRMGYYDIPRGCTTAELADELGISDQAVTERLRRAIAAFTQHALFTPEPET